MSAQSAIGTSVQGTQYAMNPQQQQVYSQRQIGANNLYHGQNGQPYYNTASPYQTNQNVNNNQQHQSLGMFCFKICICLFFLTLTV